MAEWNTKRAIVIGIVADLALFPPFTTTAFLSGSASAFTEGVRGALLLAIDFLSFALLAALNRRKATRFEFGLEKIQVVVQIVIAIAMCFSLVLVGHRIAERLEGSGPPPDYVLCLVFAGLCYVNLLINVWMLKAVTVENSRNPSVILSSQIRNRKVMMIASVVATLTTALVLIPDGEVFRWADVIGAIIVALVLAWNIRRLLGSGMLALLDAPMSEPEKLHVFRAVVAHHDEWDTLQFLRTRSIGHTKYVEVGLSFAAGTPVKRALAVTAAVEASILREVSNAVVSVYSVPDQTLEAGTA